MVTVGDLLVVMRAQDQFSPVIKHATTMLGTMNPALQVSTGQIRSLEGAVGLTSLQFGNMTVSARLSQDALNKIMDTASMTSYQFTLLGRGLIEAGIAFSTTLTAGIAAATNAVIEFGAEWETQATRVITLAGASREQMEELTPATMELARSSGIGASELAKGLYVLLSAQQSTTQAMETMRVTAQMSALGMGNMHDVTLATTGAVFAYGEANLSAKDAAEILIRAVQLGNMEIQDLVPAVAKVSPIAAALGVSFEDVAAALATFTHAGVNSAVAATGLRAMLNNILMDSAKTQKGFKELSNVMGDASITMDNFRQAIREKGLTQAMLDLTLAVHASGEAGVDAFAKIFPNIRGLTQALFVYHQNGELLTNTLDRIRDREGLLEYSTAQLQSTWNWQWQQMKAEVEILWITLSKSLLPIFKDLLVLLRGGIGTLQKVAESFNTLPLSIKYVILMVAAFAGAFGPLLLVSGQFIMAAGNVRRAFGMFNMGAHTATIVANTAALQANTGALAGNAAAATAAASKVGFFGRSLALLTNPVTLIIASIGLVVTALRELGVSWADIFTAMAPPIGILIRSWDDLKTSLETVKRMTDEVKSAFIVFSNFMNDVFTVGVHYLKDAFLFLYNEFIKHTQIGNELKIVWESGKTSLEAMGLAVDVLTTAFKNYKTAIINSIPGYKDFVFLSLILKVGYKEAKNVMEDFIGTIKRQADEIRGSISGTRNFASSLTRVSTAVNGTDLEFKKIKNTFLSATVAHQKLIDAVDSLSSEQKAAIKIGYAYGYAAQRILKEMEDEGIGVGVTTEMIVLYHKQLAKAAEDAKKAAKSLKVLTDQEESYQRVLRSVTGEVREHLEALKEQPAAWARVALAAGMSVEDVSKATKIAAADVRIWKKEITALVAEQERAAKDLVDSQNKIAQNQSDTDALLLSMMDQSYEARKALIHTNLLTEMAALDKRLVSNKQYVDEMISIYVKEGAARAALDAIRLEKATQKYEELTALEEQWFENNLALYDQYSSKVLDGVEKTYNSQVKIIEANATKALAANKRYLSRQLLQIIKNDDLTFGQKLYHYVRLQKLAAETAAMIEKIEKEEKAALRIEMIGQALDKLSAKFGSAARTIGNAWKIITNKEVGADGKALVSGTDKWIAGLSAASSILDQFVTSTSRTATAVKSMASMAAAGAAIGSAFTPLGTAIGAVVGAIAGLVSGWNAAGSAARDANRAADKELETLRSGLLKTYGSLQNIDFLGKQLGVDLAGAWGDTTVAGLEHFAALVDEFEKKMESLQSSLQKYGLTWKDLGEEMRQFFATKIGGNIVAEIENMQRAGVDVDKIIRGMSESLNQYIIDSIEAGTQIPPAMEPIIRRMIEMGQLTDDAARAMLGLARDTMPSLADVQAAAERYGLTLDQLGPKVQQLRIDEAAAQIVKDFKTLTQAGADFNVIMTQGMGPAQAELRRLQALGYDVAAEGSSAWEEYRTAIEAAAKEPKTMGDQIQDLVTRAIELGLELPSSMQPIIEKMIEAGLLTDENGVKLTDLSKLTFAIDLKDMFEELIEKLDEMIAKITEGFVPALRGMGDTQIPPIRVPYKYVEEGDLRSLSPSPNDRQLHGLSVTPSSRAAMSYRPTVTQSTTTTVVIQAWDGASVDSWLRQGGAKKITNHITPQLPGVVKRYIGTK